MPAFSRSLTDRGLYISSLLRLDILQNPEVESEASFAVSLLPRQGGTIAGGDQTSQSLGNRFQQAFFSCQVAPVAGHFPGLGQGKACLPAILEELDVFVVLDSIS